MAKLTKCKDCGKEISTSAKACPHCGKPQRKTSGCVWLMLILLGIMLIGMMSGKNNKSSTTETTVSRPSRPAATATPDALTMMDGVFIGEYSKDQIQASLDKAMTL